LTSLPPGKQTISVGFRIVESVRENIFGMTFKFYNLKAYIFFLYTYEFHNLKGKKSKMYLDTEIVPL